MKNISTVSDQSAAAVSEASVSIDGQLGMVVQMNQEAQELGKTAEKLVEAISIFKI